MDKKTKILLGFFFFCFLVALVLAYVRMYVTRDYVIRSEVECDPKTESCFIYYCEEECTAENEISYYKIQSVRASALPLCDPHVTTCPEVACDELDTCTETLCQEEDLAPGEECSHPADFAEEVNEEDILTPIELPSSISEETE